MKKRIGAVLMAGVMTVSLAASLAMSGCNGGQKPDFEMPEGGFDTTKEVNITFYHTMGQQLAAKLVIYLDEFKKLYPNITVVQKQIGGYDDVFDQVQKEIMAGTQPNFAYCYSDHVAVYNSSRAVLPLDDFLPGGAYADMTVLQGKIDENGDAVLDAEGNPETEEVPIGMTQAEKDRFIKGYYEEGYKFDDETKMYTLPFAKSTEVLYYDKTFFDANNLTPPKTWEEMEEVCAKIKELDPKSIPLGYDSEANWFITMCEQYNSPYTSSEGQKYRFDNETNRRFVKMLKEWYDKGYFTTQTIYTKYTSNLFVSTNGERCYMCIGSSAGASHQFPPKEGDKYRFKVGIEPIPQVDPERPKVISQGPSVCIFKNEDPQEVLASWLLVKYLATSVNFQAEFSTESGYLPALTYETMRENPVYAKMFDEALLPDKLENDNTYITSLSAYVCMQQEDAYYTSPAFLGSSKAREQVGLLMQSVFTDTSGNIDGAIDAAFKKAIEECEYFSA